MQHTTDSFAALPYRPGRDALAFLEGHVHVSGGRGGQAGYSLAKSRRVRLLCCGV